jgi:hypothetical protein
LRRWADEDDREQDWLAVTVADPLPSGSASPESSVHEQRDADDE